VSITGLPATDTLVRSDADDVLSVSEEDIISVNFVADLILNAHM